MSADSVVRLDGIRAERRQGSRGPVDAARFSTGIVEADRRLGGGLPRAALHEMRCDETRAVAAAAGFLLSLLARLGGEADRRIAWVLDPAVPADAGLPCPDGVMQYGVDPARLVMIAPRTLCDALWAVDQAARCGDLAAAVLHVAGNPPRLDMTASRRLMLRARESGVFTAILRQGGQAEPGAAATRWRVSPLPSPGAGPEQGSGAPCHLLTLERNRTGPLGEWPVVWNPQRKGFDHVDLPPPDSLPVPAASADGPHHAPAPGADAEPGRVVAFGRAS